MNRLLEISAELKHLYPGVRMIEVALSHHQQDVEGRKVYLAPLEGWPGKNEGERKIAAERAYAADEYCSRLATLIRKNEGDLAEIRAQVDGLEAERRALEWFIRLQMVEVLQGLQVYVDNGTAENGGIEAVIDQQVDQGVVEDVSEAIGVAIDEHENDGGPFTDDDDYGFLDYDGFPVDDLDPAGSLQGE